MILWSVVGVVVLIVVLKDLVETSIAIGGHGGPVMRRLAAWIYRLRRPSLQRESGRGTAVGTGIMLAIVLSWLVLSWLGWFLVFLGVDSAVVSSTTGEPADVLARLYYAGFTLFTLGLGDYRPEGGLWQVVTALAAGHGFFVLTLSVTYVVPVVSAVATKRKVARSIWLLGATPVEMVRTGWTGSDHGNLPLRLDVVSSDLLMVQQHHYAYPVLHYFVSIEKEAALGRAVAVLDEALLLWRGAVEADARPEDAALQGIRRAIDVYLETRGDAQIGADAQERDPPPPPPLDALREAGVPTVGDDAFLEAVQEAESRRRMLVDLVEDEGWSWEDVHTA